MPSQLSALAADFSFGSDRSRLSARTASSGIAREHARHRVNDAMTQRIAFGNQPRDKHVLMEIVVVDEDFWLCRFGDAVGAPKRFRSMSGLRKARGCFYLSVPIGPQRIEFNALRVFGVDCLLRLVDHTLTFDSFLYFDDRRRPARGRTSDARHRRAQFRMPIWLRHLHLRQALMSGCSPRCEAVA